MSFRRVQHPSARELIEAYEKPGASIRTLAHIFGVHCSTIRLWLRDAGHVLKPVGDKDGKAWRNYWASRSDRRREGQPVPSSSAPGDPE